MITSNTTIIGRTISCQVIVNSGNLTLKDSSLTGEVYNNGNGSVLIDDSTLNGGSDTTETVLGGNITIERSNLYGNQHEVYCSGNCTIEDSWLHDNHDFGSADHQNGFLTTGGSQVRPAPIVSVAPAVAPATLLSWAARAMPWSTRIYSWQPRLPRTACIRGAETIPV